MKIQCMGRSMPGIRMFSCKDRRNTAGIQCARSDIKQQLHECCGHEWQKITAFQEKLHFVIGMLNPERIEFSHDCFFLFDRRKATDIMPAFQKRKCFLHSQGIRQVGEK